MNYSEIQLFAVHLRDKDTRNRLQQNKRLHGILKWKLPNSKDNSLQRNKILKDYAEFLNESSQIRNTILCNEIKF